MGPPPVTASARSTAGYLTDANHVACPGDHLWHPCDRTCRVDFASIEGSMFWRCDRCRPASYVFVHFAPAPVPTAYCYPISLDSWAEWVQHEGALPPIHELLHRLRDTQGKSYNPHFTRVA